MDKAGYRSAPAYIAELRLRHIELDFAISPALDRTFKKVNDAITRGLGPAKKAPEVKLSAIQYTVASSVVGAADAYVVSLHWLLRADETENLLLSKTSLVLHDSRTDPGDVTLRVPTSKTDPRGNGASRRLTCICKLIAGMGDPTPDACPTCAVRRQVSRLRLLFGWELNDEGGTRPLFPRLDGSRAAKAQLVEAWGVVTSQNDKPTGHSPRRSGAKRYARQGWSVWMIQFMGRWAASTVLEYIEEAMAEVTACWARLPVCCPSGELEANEAGRLAGTKGGCPKLSERVDRIEQIILDTRERLAQSESQGGRLSLKMLEIEDQVMGRQWVWKTTDSCERDRTVHLVVEESLEWPNALWTTKCGWRFGAAHFNLRRCGTSLGPGWRMCQRCARREFWE